MERESRRPAFLWLEGVEHLSDGLEQRVVKSGLEPFAGGA